MPSLAGILYVQSKQMLAFFATPRFGGKRATLGTKTVCSNGLSEGPCTMAFYEVGGQGLFAQPNDANQHLCGCRGCSKSGIAHPMT